MGVIPFEYIAGVSCDGKFAGSMINQSAQIVLMDEWKNDSLCCEDAKRILQGYYLFILLLFSVITSPCCMFYFQLTGFFVKMVIQSVAKKKTPLEMFLQNGNDRQITRQIIFF